MQLTHLGHACVLVDTGTARLLIDPGDLSNVSGIAGLDAVLITHQHADHVDPTRIASLLAASPQAKLMVDTDTAGVVDLPHEFTVVRPGDQMRLGGATVDVVGGIHAAVYGDIPGCSNVGYLIDDGAFFHPGDSFTLPAGDVDVLAVAIDAPWLKIAEAAEYVRALSPRAAITIHDGATIEAAKYTGMIAAFSGCAGVTRLAPGEASTL